MIADSFGHCVVCHKNMIVEKVIDQKVQKIFLPEYSETEYLLDDGSRMRVAICSDCKTGLTEEQNEDIMNCVIEGWKIDVKNLNWTEEKKKDYLDRYSKLKIVTNSDNIPSDLLSKKLKEFKEK